NCQESNHINLVCTYRSRHCSIIEKVFNFSIVYVPGTHGELYYVAFANANSKMFSNFYVYLDYDGFHLIYCVFEKRMNRSDVGVWINVFDKGVWSMLLSSVVLTCIILWIKRKQFLSSIFDVVGAVFRQSLSFKKLIWLSLPLLVILSNYENYFTSDLTVVDKIQPMKSLKEVVAKGYTIHYHEVVDVM